MSKTRKHSELIAGGYTVYKDTACPYCEGKLYYKKLGRKNEYGEVDMYCRHCKCMVGVDIDSTTSE